MTEVQANHLLRESGSPSQIERNDVQIPPWRIQLSHGAATFRTLQDALRFALALLQEENSCMDMAIPEAPDANAAPPRRGSRRSRRNG